MLDEGVREHWASEDKSSRNLAGRGPRPRGWQGRGGGDGRRISQPAQGQARLPLRRAGGWGISTHWCFVQTSLSPGEVGKGKIRITRPNSAAFPLSSSTSAGEETEAQRGRSQDQTWTSSSHSRAFAAPFGRIPQDPGLWGKKVCGHWQGSVPEA